MITEKLGKETRIEKAYGISSNSKEYPVMSTSEP
jgi:hypothetical protein